MLYEIYSIRHYHSSIINSIIILRLKLYKLTQGVLRSRDENCESSRLWEKEKNVIKDGVRENL